MTAYQRTDDPALLAEENAHLLDDLEVVYNQFILLKNETDVSYAQLRSRNKDLERNVEELGRAYNQLEATRDQLIHSERLAAMGQLAASHRPRAEQSADDTYRVYGLDLDDEGPNAR